MTCEIITSRIDKKCPYLEILINDEKLRNSMGLLGRKKTEEKYSYQVVYKEYIEAIRSKSGND